MCSRGSSRRRHRKSAVGRGTSEFRVGPSGKISVAAILDLFSRQVVGWAVSAVTDRHLTVKALEMAIKRRCPDAGLLPHSDQGSTDASEDYQRSLGAHGITCSMSRRGNCYDNAVIDESNLRDPRNPRLESNRKIPISDQSPERRDPRYPRPKPRIRVIPAIRV